MKRGSYVVLVTLIFLLLVLFLEYLFNESLHNKSYSFLYSGKDGGIFFRIKFLLVFSLLEIAVRNQFKIFSLKICFYLFVIVPVCIVLSYFFWFFLLPGDGLGWMLSFLGLLLLTNLLVAKKISIQK